MIGSPFDIGKLGYPGLLSGMQPDSSKAFSSETERRDAAIAFAVSVFGRWFGRGRVYIPELDETVAAAAEHFVPIYQRRGRSSEAELTFVGYEVSDLKGGEWKHLFEASPEAAAYIRMRFSQNLSLAYPMPKGATAFLGALTAKFIEQPRRPPRRHHEIHRNTLISGISRKVTSAFGYPLGANILTFENAERPPVCACTISAAGWNGFGSQLTPIRAHKICYDRTLPIEIADKFGVFWPNNLQERGALLAYAHPELYADAGEFPDQMERAKAYFD
ncbi:hypothetical protein N8071_00135 [bacterium]|nr:hypothetical protein [bacterium]